MSNVWPQRAVYALVSSPSAASRRVLKRTAEDGLRRQTHVCAGDGDAETTVREHVYRWFVPTRRHVCDALSLSESRWWNQPPLAAGLGSGCRHGVKNISNCQMRLRRDCLMWDDCAWASRQRLTKKITHRGFHWEGSKAVKPSIETLHQQVWWILRITEFFFFSCMHHRQLSCKRSAWNRHHPTPQGG